MRPINLQLHNVRTPNAGREYHGQKRAREWMQQQHTTDDGAFILLAGQVPRRTHLQAQSCTVTIQSGTVKIQSNTVTDGCNAWLPQGPFQSLTRPTHGTARTARLLCARGMTKEHMRGASPAPS